MSVQNSYDGGSVEIDLTSNGYSTTQETGEDGELSEYIYVKYCIANKRLSAMEGQPLEHEITIDKYAVPLQNVTQQREAS